VETVDSDPILRNMEPEDIDRVLELITASAYPEYGLRARTTVNKHFSRIKHDDDDGRSYFVAERDEVITGVCGLHHYEWGPSDVVWLGWFHVHPDYQRKGIGKTMMEHVCRTAEARGYRRLFVEVYENDELAKGRKFYDRFGFELYGRVEDYEKEGVAMLIFGRPLQNS
jgi:GNAT superfamily N-acetyltransferase